MVTFRPQTFCQTDKTHKCVTEVLLHNSTVAKTNSIQPRWFTKGHLEGLSQHEHEDLVR